MKKISILTLIYCLYSLKMNAQQVNILGLWQADQEEVTSMYLDTYEFLIGNEFIFRPNNYNGLNRILEIKGSFKITGDSIYFCPQMMLESVGGYPIRSTITTESDSWEITGEKTRKVKCKSSTQSALIKFDCNKKSISIDNKKYFYIQR